MKLVLAAVTLLGAAVAQGMPSPLPGLPMTPPPVDHPALAAQPLMQNDRPAGGGGGGAATPAKGQAQPMPDPATVGPKLAGKDLKKAVGKVADLKWHGKLGAARADAAASDKPILWLDALGDLEGFA